MAAAPCFGPEFPGLSGTGHPPSFSGCPPLTLAAFLTPVFQGSWNCPSFPPLTPTPVYLSPSWGLQPQPLCVLLGQQNWGGEPGP